MDMTEDNNNTDLHWWSYQGSNSSNE